MDISAEPLACRFDEFLLDREGRVLYRLTTGGERREVSIGSRALEILWVLIDRHGEFISRREIMGAVWPNAAVEESNLTVQMAALRRVLDAGRPHGSCIQTVPGRGYRFLPQITQTSSRTVDAGMRQPFDGQISTSVPTTPDRAGSRVTRGAGSPRRIPWLGGLAGAAGLLLVVLFVGYAWYCLSGSSPKGAYPRLSVAVLPFDNLSGDVSDNRLADGITEDLTTDLTYIPDAFVAARKSSYSSKDKANDVRRIGEELGVRYVVNGSLQKLGDILRVNVQLTSTETGAHVWSDRFDEQFDRPSAQEQEHIISKVKDEIAASIVDVEAARSLRDHPTDPDAFDLILRARSLRNLPPSPQRNKEVFALLEQALALDPTSVYAMTYTAFYSMEGAVTVEGWGNFESMQRAGHLLMRARSAAPDSDVVLNTYVYWLRTAGFCPEAIELTQQAIQTNPGRTRTWTGIYNELSICKTLTGHAEEGLTLQDEADRLNPLSAYKFIRYAEMGWMSLMLGRDREAVMFLERSLALQHDPDDTQWRYRLLAAAYAGSGQMDEARRCLSEADRLWPYVTVRLGPLFLLSPIYGEQWQRHKDALRLAGERDHADEDADFGVPKDGLLHSEIVGHTPKEASGVKTVRTTDLVSLLATSVRPLVVDTVLYSWNRSIPGAAGLELAGLGGSFTDEAQGRLRSKMQALTGGDLRRPIVAVGSNSEHFDGRNLALRLAALGYTNVYWYRGGREAWEVNGLPETDLDIQQW
jgi:TolB-like protein/DNA-binding winged helix-turn-helix (wHTH) protein